MPIKLDMFLETITDIELKISISDGGFEITAVKEDIELNYSEYLSYIVDYIFIESELLVLHISKN